MSKNMVILTGNVGNEPKFKEFTNGRVASFSLATEEKFKGQNGEDIKKTEWHNIVVRNKAAEICEKYLSKGDKVYIEGRIKTRKWQDDSGNDRYSTEIHCTDFTFLTTKKESESQQGADQPAQKPADTNKNQIEQEREDPDDLPF